MLTTTQELDAARNYYRTERIPAPALQIMDAATHALTSAGAAGLALPVGAPAPDFTLPGADGCNVTLSEKLAQGPVVLVFYRGGWCPYCNILLRGFQRLLADFKAAGAQLIAISPQLPDQSLSTREKNALQFPVLSDVGLQVAKAFRIAFELPDELSALYRDFGHGLDVFNGTAGDGQLPMPATFVIGQDSRVKFAHVEEDYTQRAEPQNVLAVIQNEPRTAHCL
jgi:peroxiredoxin